MRAGGAEVAPTPTSGTAAVAAAATELTGVHGHVLTQEEIVHDTERRVERLAEALQEKAEENVSLYQKLRDSSTLCKMLQESVDAKQRRVAELEERVKKLEDEHARDTVCFTCTAPTAVVEARIFHVLPFLSLCVPCCFNSLCGVAALATAHRQRQNRQMSEQRGWLPRSQQSTQKTSDSPRSAG